MNKNESKYFNTACLMDEALIQLINEKDYDYITVKEICKRAGVNRSTFYLHYECINDLLKETIKKIDDDFNNHMNIYGCDKTNIKDALNNYRLDDLNFINEKYLFPYLSFMKENQKIYTISFKNPYILGSNAKYKALSYELFIPILDAYKVSKAEQQYIFSYHFSGVMAIIKCWLENGCKTEIKELADIIIRCIGNRK